MKIVTIKLESAKEWRFLHNLLERLRIPFELAEAPPKNEQKTTADEELIKELFGSWESDLTSDEINKMIRDARVDQTREIQL